MVALLAGLVLLSCAAPVRAAPPGIPQEPHDSEDFIGRPADPVAVLAPAVPRHPHMAPNERSNLHNDAYSSDVNPSPGPLGRGTAVQSAGLYRECASVTFDSRDRLVTVCVGVDGPVLLMLDPATLDVLAEHPLPPRTVSGAEVFTSFGGGGYFYLDERDRAVVPTTTLQIVVIAATDPPGFRLERTYDLRSRLPADDSIVSALPDFNGRIWFVTEKGFVGSVEPASGDIQAMRLEGEGITNSFSSDPSGGVYVVSDRALYRFDAAADGAPAITWRETYENTFEEKPGQVDDGSGTTPTLMGDGLVAITDNADPMNVMVYRRGRAVSGSRVVCREPVFARGQSATDNSLNATDRSIVVENNYGYSGPMATSDGRVTAPGVERVDVLPRGRGCRKVWRSEEAGPSVVPKLSLGAGLLYTYTKAADPDDPWYLTAIDFRTGATVYKKLAGAGLGFNNHYAPATIGPNGTMYVGVLGGIVAFRDATPPESGPSTPRLRLRVTYRAGRNPRARARGAGRRPGRRCVRSGLRATLIAADGAQPDPEQVRRAVLRAGGRRLRADDHFPLSRLVPRRLIPRAKSYGLRARVTLGDGRKLTVRRRIRTCPR
jgi:hypothetical protein